MVFSSQRFFKKMNEQIRLYYFSTCFHSFFGRKWRHQKDISKLTDLYPQLILELWNYHFQKSPINARSLNVWSKTIHKDTQWVCLSFYFFLLLTINTSSVNLGVSEKPRGLVYILDAVGSSRILIGKQKIGLTFNSDKLWFYKIFKTDHVQCRC